jgi:hypothetical protein
MALGAGVALCLLHIMPHHYQGSIPTLFATSTSASSSSLAQGPPGLASFPTYPYPFMLHIRPPLTQDIATRQIEAFARLFPSLEYGAPGSIGLTIPEEGQAHWTMVSLDLCLLVLCPPQTNPFIPTLSLARAKA